MATELRLMITVITYEHAFQSNLFVQAMFMMEIGAKVYIMVMECCDGPMVRFTDAGRHVRHTNETRFIN